MCFCNAAIHFVSTLRLPFLKLLYYIIPANIRPAGHWWPTGGKVGGPPADAACGSPAFCSWLFQRTTSGNRRFSDSGPLTSRWFIITVFWRSTVGPWFIISSITLTKISLHTIMDQKQCTMAIANLFSVNRLNIQMHKCDFQKEAFNSHMFVQKSTTKLTMV